MVVFGIFFLSPFLVGGAAEYLCCRLPKKRWWRWVPLLVALIAAGALASSRGFHCWGRCWASQRGFWCGKSCGPHRW